MSDLEHLLAHLDVGERVRALPPVGLRWARRVPQARPLLDRALDDPLQRALAGLEAVDLEAVLDGDVPLDRGVLWAQAGVDGAPVEGADGTRVVSAATVAAIGRLETAAAGDPTWWVPAARVHAQVSLVRERHARASLSTQEIPYVFPGDLHATQIHVLAAGDRVLAALHVDWLRKLTGVVAGALVPDLRALGGWFWPVLRSLDGRKLQRQVEKLPAVRRLPEGAMGVAAAYLGRLGGDWRAMVAEASPLDRVLAGLAEASDAPDAMVGMPGSD